MGSPAGQASTAEHADVKDYWWYLDALPSHAWLRWRYHCPQSAFPYQRLVEENGRRSRDKPEFELMDTGVFDDNRFWAVDVTYAKASPTDILIRIGIKNHSVDEATLSVLPTMWFRNIWRIAGQAPPNLFFDGNGVVAEHPRLAGYRFDAAATVDGTHPEVLFCDNEANTALLFGSAPLSAYSKDGINDHVVGGADTVNPGRQGTKASWWYRLTVPGGGQAELRLRLHQLTGPSGNREPIRVQTLVGVIPALPAISLPAGDIDRIRRLRKRFARRMEQADRHEMLDWQAPRYRRFAGALLSVIPVDQLTRLFGTLFDEEAFLSPHGLRSISKRHSSPYTVPGMPDAAIEYEPAESGTAMYGGNSNWRGPVWFPVNYLVIRALLQYDQFFGPEFTIEYPTRSGQQFTLREVAGDLADRLVSIWVPGTDGRRPVYGGVDKLQSDPAWKDNLLFYEYFHADNGAGLGAMHQTGWTALVADLILDPPRPSRRMIFRNGHDGSTSSGMEERHDGTA